MEDGADEKLEKEIEEQLKFAELERMMMQEEAEAGDLQVITYTRACFFNILYIIYKWAISYDMAHMIWAICYF